MDKSDVIFKQDLINAIMDKWRKEHPVYEDTNGSMSYSEIIEFIKNFNQ